MDINSYILLIQSCFQTHRNGHVLNGIDLTFQSARGLFSNPNLVDFSPQSQRLFYVVGSNIISYNTHRRFFTLVVALQGQPLALKVYLNKAQNLQYLLYAETNTSSTIFHVFDLALHHPLFHIVKPQLTPVVDLFYFSAPVPTLGYLSPTLHYFIKNQAQFQQCTPKCKDIVNSLTNRLLFCQQLNCFYFILNYKLMRLSSQIVAQTVYQSKYQIESIALNERYIAILSNSTLTLLSLQYTVQQCIQMSVANDCYPINVVFSRSFLLVRYRNSYRVSTLTIKNLKSVSDTMIQLPLNTLLLLMFVNPFSSEAYCLCGVDGKLEMFVVQLSTMAQSQASSLKLMQKKYQRIHVCPWECGYILQAEGQIETQSRSQAFEHKRGIAFHPSGLFAVVCFRQSFKMYALGLGGFVNMFCGGTAKDIQGVAVSQYGNHFTIASFSTSNVIITVYDFFSCRRLHTITLLPGCNLQKMQYSTSTLVCILKNKKVFCYDGNRQYRQILYFNPKSIGTVSQNQAVSSIFCDPTHGVVIFAVRSTLYFYNFVQGTLIQSIQYYIKVSCFYYNSNLSTLLMGGQGGEIVGVPWPNKPLSFLAETRVFKYHRAMIVDMRMSTDLSQLLSLAQDDTLYVSRVTYVQNLKRIEGIERENVRHNFDFLREKAVCLFAHNCMHDQNDRLKEYEDKVVNINFIFPEESVKQKEALQQHINATQSELEHKDISKNIVMEQKTQEFRKELQDLKEFRDMFLITSEKEKSTFVEKMKEKEQEMYRVHSQLQMQKQTIVHQHRQQIQGMRAMFEEEIKGKREKYQLHIRRFQEEYEALPHEKAKELREQIKEIEEQKKQFFTRHLSCFSEEVHGMLTSNGVLQCRNGDLQKQIQSLSRRIEDRKFIVHRIEQHLGQLSVFADMGSGDKNQLQEENVNLGRVEKNYVKQTKELITKDKEISLQIVLYEKEREILAYLEKHLDQIEERIQQTVKSMLVEKKQTAVLDKRWSRLSEQSKVIMEEYIHKRNRKIDFQYKVQSNFNGATLIGEECVRDHSINTKQRLTQRRLFTERTQQNQSRQKNSKQNSNLMAKTGAIIKKLQSQEKKYIRIHTEEVNYQGQNRKFMHHNQDLIQTFNRCQYERYSLKTAMAKKKIQYIKAQLKRPLQLIRKKQTKPTSFQKYLKKRTSAQTVRWQCANNASQ